MGFCKFYWLYIIYKVYICHEFYPQNINDYSFKKKLILWDYSVVF